MEDRRKPIFEVRSLLKTIPLEIKSLESGQTSLAVKPETDCLVYVENSKRKLYIRRGLNQNDGSAQKEVFILRKDGTIVGGIDWEYETVTGVEALPIDETKLHLRGGNFTHIANRKEAGEGYSYWSRNIRISRSNTVVDGITHHVTGEGDEGQPYGGFLNASRCARVIFRNCVIDARKAYLTVGSYIIRRTTLGHMGLNAIGRGNLIVEDSTLHGRSLICFREDYGSTWDGTVLIRNSRWLPPGGGSTLTMFDMSNDGTHDFGYPCSMPSAITLDGLTVEDSKFNKLAFFVSPVGSSETGKPFPYRLTERIGIKNLRTASGREPLVSPDPKLVEAIKIVR